MASPGQKHGVCGHLMAGFDSHSSCARCRDKGKDPCVEKPESACKFCDILTSDQRAQPSTPSYKLKKGKETREAKSTSTPSKEVQSATLSPTLVDPINVSIVGVVDGQGTVRSPGLSAPAEKKEKVEEKEPSAKSGKLDRPITASTDSRIDDLDQK